MGAGAKRKLVVDRLLATLVQLRHGATHDVLACWFGIDRCTSRVRSVRCGRCSPKGVHHRARRQAPHPCRGH
ncbi:transposase family protein [Streptomyces sp. NBC_01077]|uniref:transposase family protein n=1 Tax=Streptomyces sp. NBC_01077 TaxID=2903746 RepID=UPI00386C8B0D|nr:transposase family protein [Streptomyces sp. NBC_01077]WSV43684.1 transposase family protein [Streptomyces sp. NBC_01077]